MPKNKDLRILILEDVSDASNYLKDKLEVILEKPHIDQAFDLDEGYKAIEENTYDLLLLDIQLPKGTSFDLLKKLHASNKIDFEIIFVTSQQEKRYAIDAIKYSAIDYLYKPVDQEELSNALAKTIEEIDIKKKSTQVNILIDHLLSEEKKKTDKVAINMIKGVIEFVKIENIKYLEADGVVTNFHLTGDNTPLKAIKNLGYYKDFLIDNYGFFPISHSRIVNTGHVKQYSHSNLTLTLNDNTELKASRRGGKEFRDHMNTNKSTFTKSSFLKRLLGI